MTKDLLDDFARADAVNLGGSWVNSPTGHVGIVSGHAKHTAGSNVSHAIFNQATDTSDMSVSLQVVTIVASSWVIMARVSSDSKTYYGLRRIGPTTVSIVKAVADGNWATFVGPATYTVAAGDVMELRCVGNLIQAFANGTKLLEATDSAIPTGNLSGWRSTGTTAGTEFDNFRARDLVQSTTDGTAPSKVTISYYDLTSSRVQLVWAAPTDNVGVLETALFVDGERFNTTQGATTGYLYPLGSPGQTQEFIVRVYDAAGNFSTSDPVRITFQAAADTTKPSKPVVTLGQTTSTTQAITISNVVDNFAVTELRVIVSGAVRDTLPGSARDYTIQGLNAATAGSVVVEAADAAGNTTASDPVNFTTSASSSAASFSDEFDYADGNLPGPWYVSPAGSWRAAGGKLSVASTTTAAAAIYQRPLLTPNQRASFVMSAYSGTFAVLCRVDSNYANYYGFRRSSSTSVTLFKVFGSSSWSDGIIATASAAVPEGATMEIRAIGNVISGWVNGTKVVEATDDSVTTGLYAGVRATSNASGTVLDSFKASDFAGTADGTAPSSFTASVSEITDTSFLVSWGAITDDVGVAGIRAMLGNVKRDTLVGSARSYRYTGLSASAMYHPRIEAFDAAGNVSSSATLDVQTLAAAPGGTTATLQVWDAATQTLVACNNVNFRTWDPITGQEQGFFYGRTVSYWNGAADVPLVLPDARPAFDKWKGKRYCAYGDSSGVRQTTPGVDYATADLWPQLIATGFSTANAGDPSNAPYPTGLGLVTSSSAFANRHGNSFTAEDVAVRMLNSGASAWVPGSFDLVSIFVGGNNVGINHDNERGKLGYQHALSAALGILRSASRVTAATEGGSGSWAAHTTLFSGNAKVTSTYGATRTFTFTGNAATLMLIAFTDGSGSAFSYQIDNQAPVTGRTTKGQAAPTLLGGAHCPVPVHIRGLASGQHTIKVTHTGQAGDPLLVDAVLPWHASEASMPFVILAPPAYSTTAGWNNYPSPKPDNFDVDEYRKLFLNVLRQFEFATNIGAVLGDILDVIFPATNTTMRIADGLHPNMLGHKWIAQVMMEMLRLFNPVAASSS